MVITKSVCLGRVARRRASAALLVILAGAGLVASSVHAEDRPVSGRVLRLQKAAGVTKMQFSSRDLAFPFPEVGGADDPASGTPGGALIEILARGDVTRQVLAPAGLGNPGWRIVSRGSTYSYRGRAEVRSVVLTRERIFQVRAANVGPALGAPLGAVAVRVTMGSLRACAVFDAASVRRDRPGTFVAQDAIAPALADCSDQSLRVAIGDVVDGCAASSWPECGGPCSDGGVCAPEPSGGGCRCVSPTQPCGDTAPLCSGECPAGEQCSQMDSFIPGAVNACLCAPVGEPPCGATGICGGSCAAGLVCDVVPGSAVYDAACNCVDPDAICGSPGYGACPTDTSCVLYPGVGYMCLPDFCGGTFPACGGACSGGRECVPLQISSAGYCVCATP